MKKFAALTATLALVFQLNAAHIASASQGTWQVLQGVPRFNPNHQILLTDGSVLFADNGPQQAGSPNWYLLTPDSHGSYVTGTWKQVGSMSDNYAPENAGAGVLSDGRVIVVGGDMNGTPTYVGENLGAIYDPSTDSWTAVTPPNNGNGQFKTISDAPSVILADGTFMFGPSGGGNAGPSKQQQIALLNQSNLTWKVVDSGSRRGMNPEGGFTLLPDGTVLTIPTNVPDLKIAEFFDPKTNSWSTQSLPVGLIDPATANGTDNAEIGPATLMPNGIVFAEGSNGNTALYNTATREWSVGPSMPVVNGKTYTAIDAPASILPNGNVLMELSPIDPKNGSAGAPGHFFIFDGNSITQIYDAPQSAATDRVGSNSSRMLTLPNGQVLLNTRMGPGGLAVYTDSSSPQNSWLPSIKTVDNQLTIKNSYSISGIQLSGLTSGSTFGDDWNPNTNFPLVQFTDTQSGEITYAKTFDISSYGVNFGNASTVKFQVPATLKLGAAEIRVVASGFASAPVKVTITDGSIPAVATPAAKNPEPIATVAPVVQAIVAKTPALKQATCVKGSQVKKVSGSNPKCPPGFKIKK